MRAMLLEVAAGGAGLLENGLAGFGEWKFLATLCQSAWAAGARRDSAAARRVLQRRLRQLGIHPISFAAAAALPAGAAVHLRGTARLIPPNRVTYRSECRVESHIWLVSTMCTGNVRLLVEEGHDFFLDGEAGEPICVIAARGHLINADRLEEGDPVSVFGYIDRIADPRTAARSAHARGELSLSVGAGDVLPLLVRRGATPR